MTKPSRAFAVSAMLAALSLTATPVTAAELPTTSHRASADAVSNYGGGWGWGGGHRYRGRSRTSAGDVLAGVLILGTIAAVASAATKANRERRYPDRYPPRYPAPPYPERRGEYRPDYRTDGPQGLEGAADLCLREVERDARVREVTRVERSSSGWLVTGAMADGADFTCAIGSDGRIGRIEVGGRTRTLGDYEARSEDDGAAYRSAEARAEDDAAPDYPGGPLEGEDDVAEPEAER